MSTQKMHVFTRIDGTLRMVYPLTKPSVKNPDVLVKVRHGGLVRIHATQLIYSY